MLKNMLILRNVYRNPVGSGEIIKNSVAWGARTLLNCDSCGTIQNDGFHTSLPRPRLIDKKDQKYIKKFNKRDSGIVGTSSVEYDSLITRQKECIPDENLPDQLFNGVAFQDLPIVNLRCSRNNTIMNITDSEGHPIMVRSCGMEGFKHAKKGTNAAAQSTATTFGTMVSKIGITTVRATIKGLGPGRLAGVKGLTLAGLNVVSVTDKTPFTDNPPRSKKRRRV